MVSRKKKQQLLSIEERTWRLKSRATWLMEGDKNTKFFHRFAYKRRATNAIWNIKCEDGSTAQSEEAISKEAVKHFKTTYKKEDTREIADIMWGIDPFPVMFDEEENNRIFAAVTKDELLIVLKSFKKDKCPGPDGWTIDILIYFFDMMKDDILRMVEESRINCKINHILTSTFISLIPKKRDSQSFADFRPISLCNTLYKIISKLIAERICGKLSHYLTKEQHRFPKGRNIIDAVAIAQEALHSMHTKKLAVAILKIDLRKAYDCIDWGYLRCLLIKIGLNDQCTRWIMACVEGVNFAILINGCPSPFFPTGRGLRQGCALSPLLFILVMDTLSLHLKSAVDMGRVGLLSISRGCFISHNLFVDDILLFAMLVR